MRASFMPPNWGRIAQALTFPAPHSSGTYDLAAFHFFPYIGGMSRPLRNFQKRQPIISPV
jgi:hypothetical protein